jgi:hypothetical protein
MNHTKKRNAEIESDTDDLGEIMGSGTGDSEHSNVSGGWAGTDDATSTAPSDQLGNPATPEEDKTVDEIRRDFDKSIQRDEDAQSP